MNRKQEQKLLMVARRVEKLRATINNLDAVLRSYRRKGPQEKTVTIGMTDGPEYSYAGWSVRFQVPTEVIKNDLMPVIRAMRDAAAAELKAITL